MEFMGLFGHWLWPQLSPLLFGQKIFSHCGIERISPNRFLFLWTECDLPSAPCNQPTGNLEQKWNFLPASFQYFY
jgi:hypothetical protein